MHIKCASIFLLLLTLFVQLDTHAQGNYYFRHIQKEDGLSSDDILCITQDSFGYMWIGTQNGLNRFDGYQFKVFKHIDGDSLSISSNWISAICQDYNGCLWMGTQSKGLNKFNPQSGTFTQYTHQEGNPHSLSDNEITYISPNDSNSIWVGTSNGGLNLFDTQTEQFISWQTHNSPLQSNEITSLTPDGHNRVWVGSLRSSAVHYDHTRKKFSFVARKHYSIEGNDPVSVEAIIKPSEHQIWVASRYNLFKLNLQTDSSLSWEVGKNAASGLNGQYLKKLLLGKHGKLWVGTKDRGLFRFMPQQNRFEQLQYSAQDRHGLSHNNITCIYEDHVGLLWVGTRGGGLNILNQRSLLFEHHRHLENNENSLVFNRVRAIFEDSKKHIWIGTSGGFSKFDLQKRSFDNHFLPTGEPDKNRIRAFIELDDHIICATEGQGLLIHNPQTNALSHQLLNAPRKNKMAQYLRDLLQTNDTTLWAASCGGGLLCLDPKTLRVKRQYLSDKHPDSLQSDRLQAILPKSKHELWLASDNGLFLFDTQLQKFRRWVRQEGNPNSLIGNKVRALYQDSSGILWAGTRKGLVKFSVENEQFTRFSVDEGLPNDIVFGIMPDKQNNLWLTTPNGLAKLERKTETLQKINIPQNNNLDMGGYCNMSDGRMLAGGKNGFVIFHPDSISTNKNIPNLVFTHFAIGQEDKPIYNYSTNQYAVELDHTENDFTVSFSALDYSFPQKNRYAYYLNEHDGGKRIELGSKNTLSFSNVEPGLYILRVIGSNNEGTWNTKGKTLRIVIHPPWWKTWTFRWLLFMGIVVALVSFYLYRLAAVKHETQKLEHLVAMRTSELEKYHKEILVQNEEILQQTEEIGAQRDHLANTNKEIEVAYQKTQYLSQFGQQLTATLSLAEIHDMVYSYVKRSVRLDAFGVGLYRNESNKIEYHGFYEHGVQQDYFTIEKNSAENFTSLALEKKEPILENDIAKNWNRYFKQKPGLFSEAGAQSVLVIPLKNDNYVTGAITAFALRPHAFNSKTHSFLEGLASYLSIALSNAKLYGEVNRKNEHINSSIRYAKKIQQSILPIKSNVDKLVDSFILFMPKDIVSGDFYQFAPISQADEAMDAIFAVVDCTGHGVPGAFMSLIGNRVISQLVNEQKIYGPAQILSELDTAIKKALKQEQTANNDGMDVALCRLSVSPQGTRLVYAGAKRPLFYAQADGVIKTVGGTRKSIGGMRSGRKKIEFEQTTILLEQGATFYLTSDGYIDQNGLLGKRFGTKAFLALLNEVSLLPLHEQHKKLELVMAQYMGQVEQRDDITVWGIRV